MMGFIVSISPRDAPAPVLAKPMLWSVTAACHSAQKGMALKPNCKNV